MQKYLPKHLTKKSIVLPSLLSKKSKKDWRGKPADWSDIRKDCPKDSIALYAGVKSDYSAYDNLGFTATISNSGKYKVFIDGTQYGDEYDSGATCTITWSSLALTTGDNITTPEALKAHIIHIVPHQSGDTLTKFQCKRVAASGIEAQCLLWAHFNLSNAITLTSSFCSPNYYTNTKLEAITAKQNTLKIGDNINTMCQNCADLEYIATLDGGNNSVSASNSFNSCSKLTNVYLKNMTITFYAYIFNNCYLLEEIKCSNAVFESTNANIYSAFRSVRKLKKMPPENYTSAIQRMDNYLTQAAELEDTIIDARDATALKVIGVFGDSSYFASSIKGLRVSSSAPFDYGTPPQINVNVSYTGMDRAALVQLFNDLPSVSDGQIINVAGTTGADDLDENDEAIATDKGWTITK